MGFHDALEVGGVVFQLASPLLVIIFTMMMMPSGGSAYVLASPAKTPVFRFSSSRRSLAPIPLPLPTLALSQDSCEVRR